MKIGGVIKRGLIACEESGVVRRTFRDRGYDVYSCDILPARDGSPHHLQCDIRDVLNDRWDLIIAHPPCDYMANSGVQWLTRTPAHPRTGVLYGPERRAALQEALKFFELFLGLSGRVAVENPIMHLYARERLSRSYTQIIQPFQFGHSASKATCLWLQNLPKLTPTRIMPPPYKGEVHHEPPGPLRKRNRSTTYQGFANAMADQWGQFL